MTDDRRARLEEEFLKAYEAYADAIYRHCTYRLYGQDAGRDATQEVFLRAWEYIESGKTVDNMRAFLYKIANNLIVDTVRKKKELSLDALMENDGFEPSQEHEKHWQDAMEKKRIIKTLQKVDETYREVLVMRFIDELSPGEIADVLGVSSNVISVRIHRGLKQLRSFLGHARPH